MQNDDSRLAVDALWPAEGLGEPGFDPLGVSGVASRGANGPELDTDAPAMLLQSQAPMTPGRPVGAAASVGDPTLAPFDNYSIAPSLPLLPPPRAIEENVVTWYTEGKVKSIRYHEDGTVSLGFKTGDAAKKEARPWFSMNKRTAADKEGNQHAARKRWLEAAQRSLDCTRRLRVAYRWVLDTSEISTRHLQLSVIYVEELPNK